MLGQNQNLSTLVWLDLQVHHNAEDRKEHNQNEEDRGKEGDNHSREWQRKEQCPIGEAVEVEADGRGE